jgi:hypothetical protein
MLSEFSTNFARPCSEQWTMKGGVLEAGHNSLQQQSAIRFEPKK